MACADISPHWHSCAKAIYSWVLVLYIHTFMCSFTCLHVVFMVATTMRSTIYCMSCHYQCVHYPIIHYMVHRIWDIDACVYLCEFIVVLLMCVPGLTVTIQPEICPSWHHSPRPQAGYMISSVCNIIKPTPACIVTKLYFRFHYTHVFMFILDSSCLRRTITGGHISIYSSSLEEHYLCHISSLRLLPEGIQRKNRQYIICWYNFIGFTLFYFAIWTLSPMYTRYAFP